jgi:hypothetical protein
MQVPWQSTRPVWQLSWQLDFGRPPSGFPPVHTYPPPMVVQFVPGFVPVVQSPVAPQYTGSVRGLTHVLLQSMRPAWHVSRQLPPLQMYPALQMLPELAPWQFDVAPQNRLFVFGSTHVPPHARRPGEHVS